MTRYIAILLLLASATAGAQVGAWRTHTDMQNVRSMAASVGTLWAATRGGVFSYDLATGSYRRYTNIDGLDDIEMNAIAMDSAGVVYAGAVSGALNILAPGQDWISIPDISRATSKPRRGINVFRLYKSLLYIGTDFGIVVFNPAKREFGDTYTKFGSLPSQSAVNDLLFHNDSLWVATDNGIAVTSTRNANLQDPAQWLSYRMADGLTSERIGCIAELEGTIIAGQEKGIAAFTGAGWAQAYTGLAGWTIKRMFRHPAGVYAVTERQLFDFPSLTTYAGIGDFTAPADYPSNPVFNDVTRLSDGRIVACTSAGFSTYMQAQKWDFLKPNGPASNQFLSLSVDTEGLLWSASGGDPTGVGCYSFDGSEWRNRNEQTDTAIASNDIFVTASASDGSMWFGTWGFGAINIGRDGSVKRYSPLNVPGFPGDKDNPNYAVVSGIAQDADGGTWFLNYRNADGTVLSCRTADGKWKFFKNTSLTNLQFSELAADPYGNKWFHGAANQNNNEVLLFNENGTPDNAADDTWVRVDTRALLNEGASVLSIAVDKLGDVWIGAALGLRTIFNVRTPDKVSRTCYNTRCNIEGQKINCIEVDPVNNKWIGTSSGVFVLSSDGSAILAQYSTDNSPLLSNEVRTIAVHPTTGVAYIGTSKGLSSVGTPYLRPSDVTSGLRISPNPFHPGIDEKMLVDGLTEGSTIRILTISGSVVADIPSPGGRIGFWDGKTSQGDFAPSGIYIVAGYNEDGTAVVTGKVAVVRK
jgi:ligand-binding sensor domain-containing protein